MKIHFERKVEKPKNPYPCIRECVDDGYKNFIVLSVDESKGTVLNAGSTSHLVGCQINTWNHKWQRYVGDVVLSND